MDDNDHMTSYTYYYCRLGKISTGGGIGTEDPGKNWGKDIFTSHRNVLFSIINESGYPGYHSTIDEMFNSAGVLFGRKCADVFPEMLGILKKIEGNQFEVLKGTSRRIDLSDNSVFEFVHLKPAPEYKAVAIRGGIGAEYRSQLQKYAFK
jgi:hypothetical protein